MNLKHLDKEKQLVYETLKEFVSLDKATFLPLTDIAEYRGSYSRLYEASNRIPEVFQAFSEDHDVVFMHITELNLISLPVSFLNKMSFVIELPLLYRGEIKHLIGSNGKNINEFIRKLNSLVSDNSYEYGNTRSLISKNVCDRILLNKKVFPVIKHIKIICPDGIQ